MEPELNEADARLLMQALAAQAPFSRQAPEFTRLTRVKVHGGYLLVNPDVCFAVGDGKIRTVLTRKLALLSPPPPDRYPPAVPRTDPHWPERRYITGEDGRMQCRTIVDGGLIVAHAITVNGAYKALAGRRCSRPASKSSAAHASTGTSRSGAAGG
jgi:hypothetical protein